MDDRAEAERVARETWFEIEQIPEGYKLNPRERETVEMWADAILAYGKAQRQAEREDIAEEIESVGGAVVRWVQQHKIAQELPRDVMESLVDGLDAALHSLRATEQSEGGE